MDTVKNMMLVFILLQLTYYLVLGDTLPRYFRQGDFYPTKGETDARRSEMRSSGAIRDVIKRNSPRFRKVLIRNTNPDVVFESENSHYMTSRGKSKLDILSSLMKSRKGKNVKVLKAWAPVDRSDMMSLHHEGMCLCFIYHHLIHIYL